MWTALGKGIRDCLLGAIILVSAAIVVGAMTDNVPAAAFEPIVEFFRYAFLLVFASVTWAAHALGQMFASYSSEHLRCYLSHMF
jgi:hypothetical protein